MKRLYRATAEVTLFFVAEEGFEEKDAERYVVEEVRNNGATDLPMSVREVMQNSFMRPQSWDSHALVYGTDEDTTLEEAVQLYSRSKPVSR